MFSMVQYSHTSRVTAWTDVQHGPVQQHQSRDCLNRCLAWSSTATTVTWQSEQMFSMVQYSNNNHVTVWTDVQHGPVQQEQSRGCLNRCSAWSSTSTPVMWLSEQWFSMVQYSYTSHVTVSTHVQHSPVQLHQSHDCLTDVQHGPVQLHQSRDCLNRCSAWYSTATPVKWLSEQMLSIARYSYISHMTQVAVTFMGLSKKMFRVVQYSYTSHVAVWTYVLHGLV